MQITLTQDTGKHKKGTRLRVWQGGPLATDQVDPQRAEQWVADGVATVGEAPDPDPGDADEKPKPKSKRSRKRGR